MNRQIVKFMCGIPGKFSLRFFNKKIILLYHSVSPPHPDIDEDMDGFVGTRRSINLDMFEQHIKYLKTFADVVTLEDILCKKSGRKRWQVAITFDDGYRDNFLYALPLLEKHLAPVTVFVSTAFVEDADYLPWWDLVDLVSQHRTTPFSVKIDNRDFLYAPKIPGNKNSFQKKMSFHFKKYFSGRNDNVYAQLLDIAGDESSIPMNAFARKEEIKKASSSQWLSIGGHTVSHFNMVCQDRDEIFKEVADNRKSLQELTEQPVDFFAYPFGNSEHFDSRCILAIKEAGFKGALTTIPSYLNSRTDPYKIPRLSVNSKWDVSALKAAITGLPVHRMFTTASRYRVKKRCSS